jgi:hypothetical protein
VAALAGSCTKHHHRAAGVLLGGGDLPGGLGTQTGLDCLPLKAGHVDAVEPDDASLGCPFAARIPAARSQTSAVTAGGAHAVRSSLGASDDLALSFNQNIASAHAHARSAAHVAELAHAGHLRRRRGVAAGAVERLKGRGDRAGEQTATTQVGTRAAQERESPGRAAEKLDRLHRHDAQTEVMPAELECACVGAHDLDLQLRGALLQSAKQGRVEVKGCQDVPVPGEIERHSARPGADV